MRDTVVILSHISVVLITSARWRKIFLGKAFPFADLIGFTREQIGGCTDADADGVMTAPRERISPEISPEIFPRRRWPLLCFWPPS